MSNQVPPINPEDIPESNGQPSPRILALSALIGEMVEESDRRYEARQEGRNFGPITPFSKLTQQWGGCIPDGVHMILGGSGVGKTAFALQVAAGCECPCLYVSCEMRATELLRRITARETKTYLGKFKDGSLSGDTVRAKAEAAAIASPGLVIADATECYVSHEWIKTIAKAIKRNMKSEHLLIVVDSLHSWAESAGAEGTDYELISAACRELRIIASTLGCPILAISERNRASFGKGASKDKTTAGAGSRKIEYGSESVINLERNDDKGPTPTGETEITLTFGKNRNGAAGKDINLIFEGGFQRYREA